MPVVSRALCSVRLLTRCAARHLPILGVQSLRAIAIPTESAATRLLHTTMSPSATTTATEPPAPNVKPTFSIERITSGDPDTVAPVAETLALAFDDHIMLALDGGRNMALKRARMRAAVTTTAVDLECYVGHLPGSERVDCVMLVKPPGFAHGVSPNSAGPHTAPVREMIKDRPDLIAASDQIKKIFHEVQVKAYGPNSIRDFYYISHVGTAPWAAGHGLGGRMLRWMVERGAREGVPVTLLTMTERHKGYYERFGFKAKADLEADLNGTPTHWWAMSTAD